MLLIIFFNPGISKSQTLPVGTPVLEDYYRRAQLLGKLDPNISFTVRPLYSSKSLNANNIFDPDSALEKRRDGNFNGIYRFWGKFGKIQLLPFTWENQYTTYHPYSINDGVMIPARGYQTSIEAGIYAKLGPLSFQLRPEVVYAENRTFPDFFKDQPDYIRAAWYSHLNYIDFPERFGDNIYKKFFLGQSSILLTVGPLSLGLSTENLWWGPGMRNSLMMSNTAPGFEHITFNTVRPIKTFIGSFEGQLIGGRLENSGFAPFDTTFEYSGNKVYAPKRNDWRYINGFVLSYQPKYFKGFFAGLTRTFIVYHNDMGDRIKDYLPIITPIDKKANYGEGESSVPGDQRASAFIRWVWGKEHAELYCEFLREDHAYDSRDMFLEPDHTHAYLFGFQKLMPLKREGQYLQVNLELTQLAQTGTNPERPTGSIYLHYAGISQGYTNRGQLLGAGIGPGSNMQSLQISWLKAYNRLGIQVERYVHNYDFYTSVVKDIRANWVDFSISALGEWNYKNLVFSGSLNVIRCYNYDFLYRPDASNPPSFWDPGKDVYNCQGKVSVMYRF